MKDDILHYMNLLLLFSGNQLFTPHVSPNDFLKNAYEIIEDHYDFSGLTVEFLATRMAVSKSTLNRKLSALINLSANEFIKQYRLQKAVIFLLQGKNVTETAYLSGFQTPSYFTQCFKALYKITPKEYSKSLLALQNNDMHSQNGLLQN